MVQAAPARGVEPDGGLADDPADLLGGEPAGDGERRVVAGPGEALLDDIGDGAVEADVENGPEPGVADPGGASRCVEGGVPLGVSGREGEDGDVPLEVVVARLPALRAVAGEHPSTDGVATTEDTPRTEPLHAVPSCSNALVRPEPPAHSRATGPQPRRTLIRRATGSSRSATSATPRRAASTRVRTR